MIVLSPRLRVYASGPVDLAGGGLALRVRLKTPPHPGAGALDIQMHVSGTVYHPKADLQSLRKQDFKAIISNLFPNNNYR